MENLGIATIELTGTVRPAPLPVKFAALALPEKLGLSLSRATFVDNRASSSVPVVRRDAFNEVKAEPLPLNCPSKLLPSPVNRFVPVNKLKPEKVLVPLSKATFVERSASLKVPVVILPASRLGIWL